ncbi:MarR family transcriptional regulator [Shewanella sp. Scap07]|uniref:MarR family winged helix-turn-helix transcriptional regulator n=1 Tax=Shewanella sp. Scap07 TaxID=2589987 RepID=UPI0015C0EF0A|nr:MarR family transcriptional regulator [Shewanella sp. Scap07]QLE84286.1 MarR family transcriptional regulator [Shewanella sp. Scap07]
MTDKNPNDPLALENQVCFSLYSATNAMIRAYRPLLDAIDLTYPQYLAMMVLWRNQGISVKTLGEQLYLDSGTLTPLLKRLEGKGLVTRGRCESDERVRVLHVTKAGKALHEQALSIPANMRCQVGGESQDLLQLKQLCEQALKHLNQMSNND